jgi:hypothetical protein
LSEEGYSKKYALPASQEEYMKKYSRPTSEENLLERHGVSGARVEALLDEARRALGMRENPRRPRALRKKAGKLLKTKL